MRGEHREREGTMQRMDVLVVTEYESGGEKKSKWNKIGSAFPPKDNGPGFSIVLDFPVGVTRLVVRPPMPPKADR